jgi:NAD(P)-dependent dehydrogenase (short-subunit alcohol dehydrogenase family)
VSNEFDTYTLITGASSGIGQALALKLSKSRKLILHGRNEERLLETLALCENENSGHLIWIKDLREAENLGSVFATWLLENQIVVNSFIHCAGIVSILPARSLSYQYMQDIMNVNFVSAMEIISTLVKKKINSDQLHNILFISSIWSQFGAKGYTLYCASKGALDSSMRALALELAPNVRVNSLVLGAIKTSMAHVAFSDPQILTNLALQYPLNVGEPDDVVGIAEFLISEQAKWITGQQIVVDGGRTVNMSLK